MRLGFYVLHISQLNKIVYTPIRFFLLFVTKRPQYNLHNEKTRFYAPGIRIYPHITRFQCS